MALGGLLGKKEKRKFTPEELAFFTERNRRFFEAGVTPFQQRSKVEARQAEIRAARDERFEQREGGGTRPAAFGRGVPAIPGVGQLNQEIQATRARIVGEILEEGRQELAAKSPAAVQAAGRARNLAKLGRGRSSILTTARGVGDPLGSVGRPAARSAQLLGG